MTRIQSNQEKSTVRYSDFDDDFAKNPITGNLARLTNEESVKQALRNLVLTNRGERFYSSTTGGNISRHLFELASPLTADNLRVDIETAIKQEPRVNLENVEVYDDSNRNSYLVIVYFSIINIPGTLKLEIILKRAR